MSEHCPHCGLTDGEHTVGCAGRPPERLRDAVKQVIYDRLASARWQADKARQVSAMALGASIVALILASLALALVLS